MIEYDADPYVCSAAARIGAELHRLAPAVHAAARPHGGPVLAPLRRYGGFLVDLRTLLLHGGAPLPAVRAIHRYQPGVDEAVDALAGGGWLVVHGGAVLATDRCRAVLSSLMAVLDRTSEALWGAPSELLATADALVTAARGTSEGAAFDALAAAGHPAGDASGPGLAAPSPGGCSPCSAPCATTGPTRTPRPGPLRGSPSSRLVR